jgi:flavorubredoxin
MKGILDFQARIMTSRRALHYALDEVQRLGARLIAPQHGSLLHTPAAQQAVIAQLRRLEGVGIDGFLRERAP